MKNKTKYFQVSFQPAQSGASLQNTPSQFQLVGSHGEPDGYYGVSCNDKSHWTVIGENLSNAKWRSVDEVRYVTTQAKVERDHRGQAKGRPSYPCIGIRVLNTFATNGTISLRNVRMWEKPQ